MAVQTRSQLRTNSLVIQNETIANANTASRVGGLFDDFADSVTINGERGFLTRIITATGTTYLPSATPQVLDVIMLDGAFSGTVFNSTNDYSITYQGSNTAAVRVSCQLTFAGANNKRYSFWIALNGTVIQQSLSENTTQGSHNHVICVEAFVNATTNSLFEVFCESNDTATNMTITTLSFAAYTL